jgi:hypothetical protein
MATNKEVQAIAHGRKSFCYAIIARSGAGKTEQQLRMVDKAVAKGRRCLVIDPDGSEGAWDRYKRYNDIKDVPVKWSGVVVVPHCESEYDGTPTFAYLEKMSRSDLNGGRLGPWANAIIFMDDFNEIVQDGRMEPSLMWLFRRRRQHGFDIVITSHDWRQIPPKVFGYMNAMLIGPTLDGPHCRANYYSKPALERTEKVRQYLNDYKNNTTGPNDKYDGWLLLDREGFNFKGVI